MFLKFLTLILLLSCVYLTHAQQNDTVQALPEITIKAFEHNRRMRDVPAAINIISGRTLQLFSSTSIVQAVNTTPGVRMEERSPGSYRMNMRGSSLRSPFGVRNVKVYFNDLPITDPGGHTYLNQLGFYNFNSLEIIKGPGSSLYGAGTGGVLLIESLSPNERPSLFTEYTTGSYGLHNAFGSLSFGNDNAINKAGFQHQKSVGFRNHSELDRKVFSWHSKYILGEKNQLKTTFIYGDLFYETPGALTRKEYETNPKASRPGNAFFPGAEAAKASITQKQFIAGASYEQQLFSQLKNKTVLYGMFTELRNPTIQNFGRTSEPHAGGRTDFQYAASLGRSLLNIDVGGEWQTGRAKVNIHKNVGGIADSLRSYDEIKNQQSLLFVQAVLDHPQWMFTAGTSFNFFKIGFERFAPASGGKQRIAFNNQMAPRLSIMKKFTGFNIYSSIAKGFSPPTTSELFPTGGALNPALNAEKGINYDIGMKGNFGKQLYVDVNVFVFSLQNTIVQRRTAAGGDYFINAGKTKQLGVETHISQPVFSNSVVESSMIWVSHTWHHFHYKQFRQIDNNYDGNRLPGVSPHIISSGFDVAAKKGVSGTVSYYYSSRMALNDANSEYANAYHLLGAKVGYQKWMTNKLRLKFIAGVENIFDAQYSLGNDVNGFAGRHYNAAAGRNYFATFQLQWMYKKSN